MVESDESDESDSLLPDSDSDPPKQGGQGTSSGMDLFFKLFGVGLAVWGAFFANGFQERLTGTSLLSQREQAESDLRAKMFGDLIGPIAGQPGSKPLDTDRELLLAELLALNFHEHFEFKPLLLDVDGRLRRARPSETGPAEVEESRHELRSIARRVSGREIASLLAEGSSVGTKAKSLRAGLWPFGGDEERLGTDVHLIRFQDDPPPENRFDGEGGAQVGQFEADGVVVRSPDGADSLRVIAHDPDWINETVKLDVRVWEQGRGADPTSGADFTLTWFDLPLTDNTLLKDGNRFAFVLGDVRPIAKEGGIIHVKLIWFPRGYYTPRERPVNQEELQRLIGKQGT